MAVHCLTAVVSQNKDVEIILLTKKPFRQLFENIPQVITFDIDLKGKHKGITGLRKAVKEIISAHQIDCYADIHNVLRTKLIKLFLPIKVKKATINKGRKDKKKLTKRKNKKLHQLKHSVERYADVFRKLGLNIDLNKKTVLPNFEPSKDIEHILNISIPKIGIAPFAKHKSKAYPTEKMEEVIKELSKEHFIILFGGGKKEQEITEKWQNSYNNVLSVIGKFSMKEEICIIDNCQAIVTMDSGNMHLASLTKTKIVSIWGATHPYAGFSPFTNSQNVTFIQKELFCRPCSVFGNKECYRKNYECLDIKTDIIINDKKINLS